METLESLSEAIETTGDIQSIVRTMKALFPDFQLAQWVSTGWLIWLLTLGITWTVQGETK